METPRRDGSPPRPRMQSVALVLALALFVGWASLFGSSSTSQADPPSPSHRALPADDVLHHQVRVGTYDSRAVAVAYIRSDACAARMRDLMQQRSRAEQAGDQQRIDELNATGKSMQIRMHLQGFSTAPVDDILSKVEAELATAAKRENVILITRDVDYHLPGVEVVDVTDALVALFEPSAETLSAIKELRTHEPEPIETIAQLPAVK